ncbi:hypothetical protein [Bacillus suaedae]|uniref:Uncharacterized protein n=1 Tax=Halalkalibacter suaedae TaxID=2822140 RepID=A0A941AP53_9BACI|nr:hypothetical protein [Bacillus suaedae]MBP3951117.1 hypothetical protein [Bacillus suaedae]
MHIKPEELKLARLFIYLPMARKVMEKDLTKVNAAGFKFSEPYTEMIEGCIERIGKEIYKIKRDLNKIGLKVYAKDRVQGDLFVRYLVKCRGFEQEMAILSEVMKNSVRDIIINYMAFRS